MNDKIEAFARDQIKEGLAQLPDKWVLTFKRMYSHKNLELPINQVVDALPTDKLDWALSQVQNSIKKLTKMEESK